MDASRASNCEDCPTAAATVDRLSELPDSLILSILSLLELVDVVPTTILSKRWRDLWTTIPSLDFDDANRSFIQGALSKWKGAYVQKFNVDLWEDDPPLTSDILDSWLLIPIQKKVKELYVYLGTNVDPEYCAPQPLYSCSSITVLYLTDFKLRIDKDVNLQWNQLKSLTLEHRCYLSDDAMNRILTGAPLLEELKLLSFEISENLNIRSTSLKRLKIGRENGSTVRSIVMKKAMLGIGAPNLLSLEISGNVYGACLLDVPSLTDVVLGFEEFCDMCGEVIGDDELPPLEMFEQVFRSIRHAEKLTLSSELSIQLLLYVEKMEENDMVLQFSNTKVLKFCIYAAEIEGMLDVLHMFPELVTLVVELNEEYHYTKSEKPGVGFLQTLRFKATFLGPSLDKLKTIEICWCMCDASIFLAIEILLRDAHLLDRMVFRPKKLYKHRCDKRWLKVKKKLQSMVKSSPTAEVIVLQPALRDE